MSVMEQHEVQLREPLPLPDERLFPTHGSSDMYGGTAMAAAYCGFRDVPTLPRGEWQHGWNPSYRQPFPAPLIMGDATFPDQWYWVARQDEAECLRSHGYKHVEAIGLPVVYLPPRVYRRRPGSLLVMPIHSLEWTRHEWNFEEYAETIASIRHEFREVVVCVHHSCWKNGYWIDAFRKRGFPLVSGARGNDRNALERVRCLLSSFEYVTTNGFGSQLVYAAYFGAKPSIFGPYCDFREEDFKNDPLIRKNPELLQPSLLSVSEEYIRHNNPELFCHPRAAKANEEWGRFEVGEQHKVSPRRLRALFGWRVWDRAARRLPYRVKHWAGMLTSREYRAKHAETQRLLATPEGQPTSTTLLGPPLEIEDARSFLRQKARLFDQQAYRFATTRETPRILEVGAGVGLGVCYFKRLHPKSSIVAFESDTRRFEALRKNCAAWGANDVQLVERAVTASGLRDYLTDNVDLLRLNLGGAEVDLLRDCADFLHQVEHLAVEYHSFADRPQRLDELTAILTRAGYRLHVQTGEASPMPFLYRTLRRGMDTRLYIFAFRA